MLTKPRIRKNRSVCQLCKDKVEPNFKEVALLSNYVTERGKIIGKERSGVCSKHQRALTTAIKRARHLALLPFVAGL